MEVTGRIRFFSAGTTGVQEVMSVSWKKRLIINIRKLLYCNGEVKF